MSYTPLYIATTDITDSVARNFISGSDTRVDLWMENTDLNLQALALSLGIQPTSIYTPINYFVKEYCVAYFLFLLFQDCFGENEVDDETDVYRLKLDWYKDRVNQLRSMVTKEMLLMEAASLTSAQFVTSGILFRA